MGNTKRIGALENEIKGIKRKLGMAGTAPDKPECACGDDVYWGDHRPSCYKYKPDKPEPECNCDPPFFCAVSCPICGATAVLKKQKAEYDRLCGKSDPAPPLRAQVAKKLGDEARHFPESRCRSAGWLQVKRKDKDIPFALQAWEDVPPYDTDLTAAMGALEEYCRDGKLYWRIAKSATGIGIKIGLNDDWMNGTFYQDKSLPLAICLAIVKHSEGK